MLTPELEREVINIRCQIRREEIKATFLTCKACGYFRHAAPVKNPLLCVDCYARALEQCVHVAEASVGEGPKRKQHDRDLLTMFTLGMGVVLGLFIYWVASQWN